jgi:hypothetical protein
MMANRIDGNLDTGSVRWLVSWCHLAVREAGQHETTTAKSKLASYRYGKLKNLMDTSDWQYLCYNLQNMDLEVVPETVHQESFIVIKWALDQLHPTEGRLDAICGRLNIELSDPEDWAYEPGALSTESARELALQHVRDFNNQVPAFCLDPRIGVKVEFYYEGRPIHAMTRGELPSLQEHPSFMNIHHPNANIENVPIRPPPTNRINQQPASPMLNPRRISRNGKEKVMWTAAEVDALDRGLRTYGKNWAKILTTYKHQFSSTRSNVDLKDKARNEKMKRERAGLALGGFSCV